MLYVREFAPTARSAGTRFAIDSNTALTCPACRACGIDVVEIGRVRTNQLHFKADQTALAMCLFKLRPKLPKYTVFGYERLHP